MAAKLDWLTVVGLGGESKTGIEHYGHKISAWALHVHTFGESTMKIGKNKKVSYRGCTMMCGGHADGHAGDVCCMGDIKTNKYSGTGDII